MTVMSKILFVDDEESVLKGIVLNLGKKFDITIATSPVEALQLLKDGNKFSVVVIDYIMPGMNGADLLQNIRSYDQSLVAILLTGASNFEYAANFVRKGGCLLYTSDAADE